MEIIDQHTKKIMEDCKKNAKKVGLNFDNETLEYIVTNRDLLELTPKIMIPTLYDYWVHDVRVLQEQGKYEVYPHNPYETVINTRPAISFYNDNNPDWLNVMIFYHVLGHIDFFQNNTFYKYTAEDDFTGKALSDKRMIARLRSEKGRWVDYVIEFARGIDNLVGFHDKLAKVSFPEEITASKKVDYYFDVFLQKTKKVSTGDYLKEIDRYNKDLKKYADIGEGIFFSDVSKKHPEFEAIFEKHKGDAQIKRKDLMEYVMDKSDFLNKESNKWMKEVIHVVRDTSMYFRPQIVTKIMNEGWASYWHEKLFMQDSKMKTHETDFAITNSKVMSMPRVGLNPYALGWRLWMYVEELADKGKLSEDFRRIKDKDARKKYNKNTGKGLEYIFKIREEFDDFMFINTFIDQEFVDRYRLFVAGRRLNLQTRRWEWYVKSRKAEDYKKMVINSLYHPPYITVDQSKARQYEKNKAKKQGGIYLNHHFEGKQLITSFIPMTMLGIEYLWGRPVYLETSEVDPESMQELIRESSMDGMIDLDEIFTAENLEFKRVVYTMKNRKLSREYINEDLVMMPRNPYFGP
ncbi:MAG: SpoVR family protein [Nanoarchaeota archaeon]|nr:SpoVR family protein [Nanoarchaeota archaeon]